MIETGWVSILPPLIAIVLALVTKEVYSSLFLGVLSGMVIYVVSAQEPFMAVFSRIFDMMAQTASTVRIPILMRNGGRKSAWKIRRNGGLRAMGGETAQE